MMMDIDTTCDDQATFIQLQARLEVLENMKNEMSQTLDIQQAEYEKTCKKLEDVGENFCEEVAYFVKQDSIYREAHKNRQLSISEALFKLKREQENIEWDLVQWRNKEKLVLAEQSKIKIANEEIKQLCRKKEELMTELKIHQEIVENLKKEKTIVDEYPIRDVTFLKLQETLITLQESEQKKRTCLQ